MSPLSPMERIANALEGIESMMRTDREMMRHAESRAMEQVHPAECKHPRESRLTSTRGAQVRLGCSLCGSEDISKVRGVA